MPRRRARRGKQEGKRTDGATSTLAGRTGDLLSTWEQPLLVRHVEGLVDNGRVLVLDRRGMGLSDRVGGVTSVEVSMDDIRAVMDAAGTE